MGFLDWLTGKSTNTPPVTRESGYIASPDTYNTQTTPSPQKLLDGYRDLVYSCVNINAHAIAKNTLRLYVKSGPGLPPPRIRAVAHTRKGVSGVQQGDLEVVDNHPLLDLLQEPNEYMDGYQLQLYIGMHLELMGSAYIKIDYANELPVALWVLPPQYVQPVSGNGKLVGYYQYTGGSEVQRFSTNEIIAFHYPNPSEPYGTGISPLQAIWTTKLHMDKDRSHALSILDNRARPDGILSPSGEEIITPDQAKDIERRFNQQFRYGGNGKVMVASSSLEYTPLTFNSKDMEMLERLQVSKIEIANAYGIPMSMLETRDVNRANAEAGNYQHARDTVAPRCVMRGSRLTCELARIYDSRLVLAYDNPVPEDADRQFDQATRMYELGVITLNELRRELGLSPVDGGDTRLQ